MEVDEQNNTNSVPIEFRKDNEQISQEQISESVPIQKKTQENNEE